MNRRQIIIDLENKINYFNLPGFKANTVEIINILKKIRKNLKIEFITKSNKAFSLLSNSSNFDEVFNYKLKINLKQMIETLYGKK